MCDNPHRFKPVPETSLDPQETAEHQVGNRYCALRHSGWRADRLRILRFLETHRDSDPATPRFANCGSIAWLLASRSEPVNYRIALNRCKHRLCLPCQQARARTIAYNLLDRAPKGRFRFVTLTVKSRPQPLVTTVAHLYGSFKNLRRSPWWKGLVTGGVAFLEITRHKTSGLWHPHLHLLVQGKFIPVDELREKWHATTRDSYIVDVRSPNHTEQVVTYVTAYAARDYDREILRDDSSIGEYLAATKGLRSVFTFGTFTRIRLLQAPKLEGEWDYVLRADELIERALRGEDLCVQIAYHLWGPNWSLYERGHRQCRASPSTQ